VDRSHPAIQRVLDISGPNRKLVEEMLTVLEATVPLQRIWLDVAERGDLPQAAGTLPPEEAAALESLYTHLRRSLGLAAVDARQRLLAIEPFSSYPSAVALLPDDPT
jgi:hypothetical protein